MDGSGYDLGNVYGKILLDASGMTDGINRARQTLNDSFANMGQSISAFGDRMTGLGARITALTAPMTVLSVSGIKTASDFDALMKQIELFGGVTGDELETVRQYALQMGADTKFSAQDAGMALLDLLKSGQSLEEALATLPDVLDLAAAGEMSLAQAAGITTSGLAQFELNAESANRVTNALAQAANASRADVSGLGQALSNVGPIAEDFGLDVEETSAILGVFANNGIMGAESGTQLKSMLLNLSRPTEEVQQAYRELGVSFYDTEGNLRDFNTVMLELDSALDALPVEQQNELMQRLGGSYGIVGLSALRASNGIGDMLNQMREAPEAGELADGFMNTFAGKVESLKGSFETLKIEAFTPFMNEVVAPFIDRMIVVVNGITDWVSKNPELTSTILQIGSALAVAGPTLMATGMAVSNIGTALRVVTPLFGLLTSPLGLVAGAGLVLAEVFNVDLRQAFEDVAEGVLPILESIRVWVVEEGFPAIVEFVQNTVIPTFGRVVSALGDAWSQIYPVLADLYGWFVDEAIPAIGNIIQTVFIPIIQDIGTRIGEVWAVIAPVLAEMYDWFITTAIPAISNMIQTVFIPAIQFIADVFREVYETVAPILQFLIEWFVTQAVPIIAGLINDVIIPAVQAFSDVLGAIWSVVGPVLQSLVDWFQTTGWPAIQGFIDNIITPAIGIFIETLKGIWTLVEPFLDLLVDFWQNVMGPAVQAGLDAVTPIIDGLVSLLSGIWESARPFLEGLRDGIGAIFAFIRDNIIQPVVDTILSIPRAVDDALRAVQRFFQGNEANKVNDSAQQILAPGNLPNLQQNITTGSLMGDISQSPLNNSMIGQLGLFGGSIPQRDSGGIGLADMMYAIGRPQEDNEIFVPRTDGEFIPGFMDKMNTLFERENTPTIGSVVIHANTEEGGRSAAKGFVDEFEKWNRSRG